MFPNFWNIPPDNKRDACIIAGIIWLLLAGLFQTSQLIAWVILKCLFQTSQLIAWVILKCLA